MATLARSDLGHAGSRAGSEHGAVAYRIEGYLPPREFSTALDACFKIHQLNHAHWAEVTGGELSYGTVEHGLDDWRLAPEILPAAKDRP